MATLTVETLHNLKQYFESQLELTLSSIRPTDSGRLLKNKITGFILALQDRLVELKPNLMCNGCERVANMNESHISAN